MIEAKEVDTIFRDSLFLDGVKDFSNAVMVEGIMNKVGFDPNRLESHKERIGEILEELPLPFHEKTGGGQSFLNAYMDREGNQWGEHVTMDQLVCLGLAIDRVQYCLPRDLWEALPGGVPYFVVKEKVV